MMGETRQSKFWTRCQSCQTVQKYLGGRCCNPSCNTILIGSVEKIEEIIEGFTSKEAKDMLKEGDDGTTEKAGK